MSHQEQFLDSTNIIGGWITGILCPLGLRYHALHHLFPAIPYHNLATAHRRLMDQMPADSIYRETAYPSYWSVIAELLAAVTVCPPSASTAIVGQVFNLSTKKRPTAGRVKTRPTPETRS
jgi:fatty acid desaturase